MIEILILIHFGFFGVVVIVMKAHAKMKDSKDLSKFNPWRDLQNQFDTPRPSKGPIQFSSGHQEVYKLSSDLKKSYLIGTNRE